MSAPARRLSRQAWFSSGLLILASFLALACRLGPAAPEPELFTFSGEVMGTRFNVRLVTPDLDAGTSRELERSVVLALETVDDLMTTYRESEVTRFNLWRSPAPFAVSEATAEVVALALDLAHLSDGALDITIAPLVEAFGFGAQGTRNVPSPPELAALRERIGFERLSIDGDNRLQKETPDLEIDLSSVAKGFGVDRAAATLDGFGIGNYMVEVGGEVRARGVNERGETWRVGIERPTASAGQPSGRRSHRVIALADQAMATSGDYRNYREVDGRRLSHLIDPRHGAPIEHRVASATALHEECAWADGIATVMMILGEEGLGLAEAQGWAVLLLAREGDGFVELETAAFRRLVESTRPTGS